MKTWKHRHNWLPIAFLLLGLIIVVALGHAGRKSDVERINLETRITAEQLKLRLESCFASRAGLVGTLAGYPWESQAQLRSGWANRASSLLPLYSGIQALNLVGPDGVIRVVHPVESNRAALNANLKQNPNTSVIAALQRAESSTVTSRTNIVELLQGGKGFALYKKIVSASGEYLGLVNGVFRVEDLMNSCLPEGRTRRHFAFALMDADNVFYERPDPLTSEASPHEINLLINVTGLPWRFSIAPLESYLEESDNPLDELWIALALLLIVLLTLAFRIALLRQKRLEAREEDYRLLVENQTDLLVKVNTEGEFQYVSPSYCEVFGKGEDELLGSTFIPLVHEDDLEHTQRAMKRVQQPPYTAYNEQRAMTKSGWRWFAWSNRAVLDESGSIVSITALGRDVTDIKRLEERIAHTQKMRAMGELAGGITHDFNNLLQVILGNIEFQLLKSNIEADTRKALESIRDISVRATGLTKKLATLSRQDVTHFETFEINEFLRGLEELLGHTLPASVDLSVSQSNNPLHVHGDRAQLEQVLLNLSFNARDAIESKGHIQIRSAKRTIDPLDPERDPRLGAGNFVVITVEDDGHGISSDILSRVFDPFFTTKTASTGTGLGLANSYSIIAQHDGTITVDSTPGHGSLFSVYLPLASEEDKKPTTVAATGELNGPGSAEEGGLVLVADDNPELRELACKLLEDSGFQTCAASDGRQALDLYIDRQADIRLLVLDLVMPELDGQEVAAKVREISADVPILFVSGFVPETTKNALREPLLRKPYSIEEFMQALSGLIHDRDKDTNQ